ncbi:MAG: OmpA family protein [Gammaproteobacteria bacterium]|nr:OmpA family protein [Gammaproteobacteria bacterium]
MKSLKRSLAVVTVAALLSACATDDPYQRTKTGAAIGAITGAIIGHQVDGKSGRWVGAAVGALAGGGAGYYMDNQQREFEQALAEEQRQRQLEIERLRDDTLKLSLDSEISFDLDQARIKPSFRPSLDKLAGVLIKYDRTVVHVIGHTDSSGSEAYNQELSERRAEAVSRYLEQRGVPYQRLRSEGRGELEPRESNATAAGRQLNRRVEIFVKPVVEGREREAFESPRY